MKKTSKIYIAGHRGMVGSALIRQLIKHGYRNLVVRTSIELDLRDQAAVNEFFEEEKPEYVFLAAAKVGGILANNNYRAEFIYDNLMIQANVIHASYMNDVQKLLFLGSSCIYPKQAPQPLKETYLLDGKLEPTNEPYAIAKITGIKLCEAYRSQFGCNFFSVMPTNLYGPNDNYDLANSHVLPALIRKFHEAKKAGSPSVTIWGTGKPRREFLHVDDLADACFKLMKDEIQEDLINIGCGEDMPIIELAELVRQVVGYEGRIEHDLSKPDGTPQKLLDMSILQSKNWKPKIGIQRGVKQVYEGLQSETWY